MAPAGAAADAGVGLATHATGLSARLMAGREPATLDELRFERGCHGEVCAMTWQDLVFSTAPGGIRRVSGGALRVVSHGASAKRPLPDLDWEPLAGYAVSVAGQRWGSCFELAHAGLGKSGAAQRWTSVMLLAQTATEAHRFVGYLTGCDALLRTARPTELELPMVTRAPGTQAGLRVERQV